MFREQDRDKPQYCFPKVASTINYLKVTDTSGSAGGNLFTDRTRAFESKRDEQELLIRKIDVRLHLYTHVPLCF